MSKAEQRALKAYPIKIAQREGYDENLRERKGFVKGYNQAEKDLELTWKDIEKVCLIAREVHQFRGFWCESVYQEILKRFKEIKK